MTLRKPKITLIVPVYNESGNIHLFMEAVKDVFCRLLDYEWSVIFVDDGSADTSWEIIKEVIRNEGNVQGVKLSRNFGKEIALTAGAEAVKGAAAVIFMDADLQHPPSLIPELVSKWEHGYQIIATRRLSIEYSPLRKLGSRFFYYFINRFSTITIEPYSTDYRLLDQDVLNVLKTFGERTRFFRGLIDWMGFKKTYVDFTAPARGAGVSSFSLKRLTAMAVNSFTAFSLLPLRLTGYLGICVMTMTILLLCYMLISQTLMSAIYTPLAYFMVFNTFLFGVVLSAVGMLALYIGHIHTEVVRRPLYIIQEKVGTA